MAEKRKKAEPGDDILREAREAFQTCEDAEQENRETALQDIVFARKGDQWPDNIRLQREREGRPCLTINKLPTFIRQVVNDARQNKPSIKVHPADSGADPETAELINGLIRNIEYTSNADTAYDTATECAVSGGFGYIRVGLDYAHDDAFDMDITINRVSNPFSIYGDPNSTAADSSDWDVSFVMDRLGKTQFKREYPGADMVDWDSDVWRAAGESWIQDETVTVAEWWVREEVDRPILLLADGKVIDRAAIETDPDLQVMLQTGMIQVRAERMAKAKKVTQRIISGVEVLKETVWPGKYIPIIPVYGDEFDVEGKRYFRSLIHTAIGSQQMYNFQRSAATEMIALAPKVPFIGPRGAFDTDQERWNTANVSNHPYLEYDGQVPPQRQPMDMGRAAGAIQEALAASDDMKAVIGMFDASLGQRSNETSGVAIRARQLEGDVSTFHFIDNMSRAIRHTGRILIDLIPKIYDQPRMLRVIGEDGTQEAQMVNQEAPKLDPKTGQPLVDEMGNAVMAMHDLTSGKYDLTVTTGPSFTTRREEAAAQMTEMIRAFPQAAPIVGPELAKNLDWPGADKIAEKMEAMSSGQVPEQAQQQMDAMQAELQKLAQENQQIKQENQQIKMDASIEQFKVTEAAKAAKQKIDDEYQLAQQKFANETAMAQAKAATEREIQLAKVKNERDVAAMKNDGVEEEGPDGKKTVKSGTDVLMSGLNMIGQMVVDQGAQLERLSKIIAAPSEIVRDPKTGKASGSRKIMEMMN